MTGGVFEAGGLLRASSAAGLEDFLGRQQGIQAVEANPVSQTVAVRYGEAALTADDVRALVERFGCSCGGEVVPCHLCRTSSRPSSAARSRTVPHTRLRTGSKGSAGMARPERAPTGEQPGVTAPDGDLPPPIRHELEATIRRLLAPGKGLLAADESLPTIGRRFERAGVRSTEESRRAYRELLFTAPGIGEHISGVILFDETIRQRSSDGVPFPRLLEERGAVPGIKVDLGAKPLALAPGESVTEGLDGLRERLVEYRELGARFTKWRAVLTVGPGQPSAYCISVNAHALARFAALSQEAGSSRSSSRRCSPKATIARAVLRGHAPHPARRVRRARGAARQPRAHAPEAEHGPRGPAAPAPRIGRGGRQRDREVPAQHRPAGRAGRRLPVRGTDARRGDRSPRCDERCRAEPVGAQLLVLAGDPGPGPRNMARQRRECRRSAGCLSPSVPGRMASRGRGSWTGTSRDRGHRRRGRGPPRSLHKERPRPAPARAPGRLGPRTRPRRRPTARPAGSCTGRHRRVRRARADALAAVRERPRRGVPAWRYRHRGRRLGGRRGRELLRPPSSWTRPAAARSTRAPAPLRDDAGSGASTHCPAVRSPPLAGTRPGRGPLPLRRRQRVLRALAGPAARLLVRLLRDARDDAGRGAGGETRSHLPQAPAAAGHAPPRHRLWLGLARHLRRRALRRRCHRDHTERNPGRAGDGGDPSTGTRGWGAGARLRLPRPGSARPVRRDRLGRHVRARRARAPAGVLPRRSQGAPAGRSLPQPRDRHDRHEYRASTALDAVRGRRLRRPLRLPRWRVGDRRGCRRVCPTGRLRTARRAEPAATLRAHAQGVGRAAGGLGRPGAREIAGEEVYRTWRIYMAAARRGFDDGSLDVVQLLLARPETDGPAPLPLRPWWYR